ncbi:MAG: epoxyqueuosine reductase QueH [Clostridia bacterium]|nr:epoxyqueuosine reductase QueH [Clostridia bacterium]
MTEVLLHCCCAPCSVSCVEPLRREGINPTAFWYNPNIHPFKEYEARRECLVEFAKQTEMPLIVCEDYGLRQFVINVVDDINGRCRYCYEHRLERTAQVAAQKGFKAFTTTLLASVYQQHEQIAAAGKAFAQKYGVEFFYRDFRPQFRQGNQTAREAGLYMQKYCGCIFSEEERYIKQITRDREKYSE